MEGCFGVAKRKYGMGLIKSKLKDTSKTDIHVAVLVINLDKISSEEIAEKRGNIRFP